VPRDRLLALVQTGGAALFQLVQTASWSRPEVPVQTGGAALVQTGGAALVQTGGAALVQTGGAEPSPDAARAAVRLAEADASTLPLVAPILQQAVRARIFSEDALHRRAFALLWAHDPSSLGDVVEEALRHGLHHTDFEATACATAERHFEALLARQAGEDERAMALMTLLAHTPDPALRRRIAATIRDGLADRSLASYAIPLERALLFT
jgi:hypothetical protein